VNILIVKLSAIGDVVHCLPLAAQIKARLPQAKITWLVEPPAKALLQNNKAVDQVIVFNKKNLLGRLRGLKTLGTGLGDIKSLLTKLSAEQFDLAIDAQGLLKSALLAFASGAPIRVGFRGAREGSSLLMSDTLDVGDYYGLSRHVVDLNIELANFALEIVARRKNLVLEPEPERVVFPLPEPEAIVRQSIRDLLAAGGRGAPGASAASSAQPSLVPALFSADGAPLQAPSILPGAPPEAPKKAPKEAPQSAPLEAQQEAPALGSPQALSQTLSQKLSETSSQVSLATSSEALPLGSIPGVKPPLILSGRIDCPIALLIPGTTWITKIWPANHWIDLGTALLQAGVGRLIICGGKADEVLNQSIYIGIKERLAKFEKRPTWLTENGGGAGGGMQNSTDIGSVPGVGGQNSSDIGSVPSVGGQNSTDIGSVPGVESQNSTDIGSVHGTGGQNSSDIGSVLDGRLLDLTAKTDLIQLLALFELADLVIGADTGPVHLAAATGGPIVVAIHGASPWTRNGPYGEKGRAVYKGIVCQPCFSKTCAIKTIECLRDLPASQVLEVVVQSLSAKPESNE
jgi:ADP-heptose:LPS heptosyltransferase